MGWRFWGGARRILGRDQEQKGGSWVWVCGSGAGLEAVLVQSQEQRPLKFLSHSVTATLLFVCHTLVMHQN